MKPGRAAAFAFFILLSFSTISFALYGSFSNYKETMMDLSIGKASVDTKVALVVKLYYRNAPDGEWIPFNNPQTINVPSTCGPELCDFYVYRGMKSGADIAENLNPTEPRAYENNAVDQIADAWKDAEPGTNAATIEIPRPTSDNCFVSVIYWGHEEKKPDGTYDPAKSYKPVVVTVPACGTGGIITLGDIFPTNTALLQSLCLPLVLLLGLLMASMYVQGKNVLGGFDFSSPRASGGRQYMMRKGGSVNAWGTALFSMASYGATQAVQKSMAKTEVKDLQGKSGALDKQISSLETKLGQLQGNLGLVKTGGILLKMAAPPPKRGKIQEKIDKKVEKLDARVEEVRTELSGLRQERVQLGTQLTGAENNLSELTKLSFRNFNTLFFNDRLQAGSPVGLRGHDVIINWSALIGGGKNIYGSTGGGITGSGMEALRGAGGSIGGTYYYVTRYFGSLYGLAFGGALKDAFKANKTPTEDQVAAGLQALLIDIPLTQRFYDIWAPMINMMVSRLCTPGTAEARGYYGAAEKAEEDVARLLQERDAAVRAKGEDSAEVKAIERQITAASAEVFRNYELARNADATVALAKIAEIVGEHGITIREILDDATLSGGQKAALLRELDRSIGEGQDRLALLGYSFDFSVIRNSAQLDAMMDSLSRAITAEGAVLAQLTGAANVFQMACASMQRDSATAESRFIYYAARGGVEDIDAFRRDGSNLMRAYEGSSEADIQRNTQEFIAQHGAAATAYLEFANKEQVRQVRGPIAELEMYTSIAQGILENPKLTQEEKHEKLEELDANTAGWRKDNAPEGMPVSFASITDKAQFDALSKLLQNVPQTVHMDNLTGQGAILTDLAREYEKKDVNGAAVAPDTTMVNELLQLYTETVRLDNYAKTGDVNIFIAEEAATKACIKTYQGFLNSVAVAGGQASVSGIEQEYAAALEGEESGLRAFVGRDSDEAGKQPALDYMSYLNAREALERIENNRMLSDYINAPALKSPEERIVDSLLISPENINVDVARKAFGFAASMGNDEVRQRVSLAAELYNLGNALTNDENLLMNYMPILEDDQKLPSGSMRENAGKPDKEAQLAQNCVDYYAIKKLQEEYEGMLNMSPADLQAVQGMIKKITGIRTELSGLESLALSPRNAGA
ncbi:MAG: hypothetical protein Q7T16_04325 [Candidatus Burarchaeum sp.]|nr:hypothetical protein [Candidatus Burarchaeum sp.]MDO8339856.1 hypothetical protein [Candidatus Burarchaeum sp.]